MYKQTTLKKFVIPVLLILVTQSSFFPSSSDKDDFSRFILKISLKRTYPEAQSMKHGSKSADWFIKRSKKGKPQMLEKLANRALLNSSQEAINRLYPDGVKLAIDITKFPVYSKSKSKFITKGNAEKGTTGFYQFLGFSIAERQLKSPISLHLMNKEDFKNQHQIIYEILHKIKNKIKIKMVLLDRGFISSKIVQSLYLLNCSFIIAFRKSKKLNKVFKLLEHPKTMRKDNFYVPVLKKEIKRIHSSCWVINNYEYGNPSVKVNLVIWKVKKLKSKLKEKSTLLHEYFVYATSPNVHPAIVYEYYGKRWRIETAFRQIKKLHAKTRVIDPCHRIWLFAVACLIYSSWIHRHLPKDHESVIPEDLVVQELQLAYKAWIYNRIPVRELVRQYLDILEINRPLMV
jgi:hypothetical protein